MLSAKSAHPAARAFVVQIHAEVQVEDEELRGRVEHIVSGQATHFQTEEELVAYMRRVVAEAPQQRD